MIGHSVKKLADWAGEFGERFKTLAKKISILDSYYIPTRYPNGIPDGIPAEVFNKDTAQNAFDMAKKTIKLVSEYLHPD